MMLHWITCWTALTYSPVFCDHRMKLLTQIGHERDTIAGGGKKKESLKKTSGWEINTVSASLHGHGSTDSFKWGSLQDKWVGGSPGKTVLLPPASSHEISAAVCHGLGERLYHYSTPTVSAFHPLCVYGWPIIQAKWEKLHCWRHTKVLLLVTAGCTGGKHPMAPRESCLFEQAVGDGAG